MTAATGTGLSSALLSASLRPSTTLCRSGVRVLELTLINICPILGRNHRWNSSGRNCAHRLCRNLRHPEIHK